MAVQTSTIVQIENASREMIAKARYTEEHSAPMINLVERFRLERGSDTLIVPKVAQMTMEPAIEGQDIVNEQDIGMTTVSVQPSEVGGVVVVTDRLLFQNTNEIFGMVGTQLGDAMARRKDEDGVAIFSGLNGGTDLSATTRELTAVNASRLANHAMNNKFGSKLRAVFHPGSIFRLSQDLNTLGNATPVAIPHGFTEDRLRDFWTGIKISRIPFFETGNIARTAANDGQGAIFNKDAIGLLTSVGFNRERDRKPRKRAWEVVVTADYAFFEIDDSKGAPVLMAAADTATT